MRPVQALMQQDGTRWDSTAVARVSDILVVSWPESCLC